MAKAKFKVQLNGDLLEVALSGVYDVADVIAYEKALQQALAPIAGKTYIMLSDIETLEPSPIQAIERVQQITDWLFANGCQYIINIHPDNQPIVDYQIKLAAGAHQVLMVNSAAAAQELLAEIRNK